MRTVASVLMLSVIGTCVAFVPLVDAVAAPPAAAAAKAKNWSPPAAKIYAQALSDQIMAQHPELLSVTFHGTPPGASGRSGSGERVGEAAVGHAPGADCGRADSEGERNG